jgi:GntR family transcriptional regulator, transcriptional repressor for pyruvate dehydrogenase complex
VAVVMAGGGAVKRPTASADGRGSSPLLRPVQIQSATDVVFERLQALILDRSLRPGERLPAEPDLAEALQVGRSTIREAKKALIARGLLESRGRAGAFVVGPPPDLSRLPALHDLLANPALPDLHETRQLIEVGAIRLAAVRATPSDISELYASLDRIGSDIAQGEPDVWRRLVTFHRNLVRAAHNEVLLPVYDLVAHLLLAHQVPFYPSIAELEAELRSHRELVALVARRDPDAAAAAMHSHLDDSEQRRQDALDQDEEST